MSIFSKLLKRGPEEGGPPPPEAPGAAPKPGPAAREAVVAATPPKTAPPPAEAKASPTRLAPSTARPLPSKPTTAAASPAGGLPKAGPARVAAKGPALAPVTPAARVPSPLPDVAKAKADTNGVPGEAQLSVGSVDLALDRLFPGDGANAPAAGVSTAADTKAVLATFEELAVGHAAEVRNLMMEVRWGEARTSWFEQARPTLKSLRAMAGQVEHVVLGAALDGFGAAVEEALRPGAPPALAPATRDKLLAAYASLVTALPAAFELEGERDRREPLIVRALLGQVQGLEPLMIDRMMAAGLGRLEALTKARAEEICAVAGLPADVGASIVTRVQAWRRGTPAALATPDRAATARELVALVQALEADHAAFEEAARGWSEADRAAKSRLRRQREVGFLQLTIVLVRLGEIDLPAELERLPFARRLEELARFVGRLGPMPPAAAPPDGRARKLDKDLQSGAHAAP